MHNKYLLEPTKFNLILRDFKEIVSFQKNVYTLYLGIRSRCVKSNNIANCNFHADLPRSVSHFHPEYFQSSNKRKIIIKLWYPTYYELLFEIAPHPYILQKQIDQLNDFLIQTSGFKLSIWLMINYTLFLGHIWRILVYSVLFMF